MKRIVTLFKSVKDVKVGYDKDVLFVLNRIKDGSVKDIIEKIRSGKKELKVSLSGVCFNGAFRYRGETGLKQHSGLCIFDFDKIPEKKLIKFRKELQKDPFIFACWISPSGNGLKALVKIPEEPENHKLYHHAIAEYFNSDYLDAAGHDISRFCFESYDPDIYINEESDVWDKLAIEDVEDLGTTEAVIPITNDNRIISNLLKWWNDKYGFVKDNRNNNLFKLAIAFNDFGIQKSEAIRVLQDFREKDFNDKEIQTILNSAYRNEASFGSKSFEDVETHKKIEKMIRTGKKKADVIRTIKNVDTKVLESSIETIKENISIKDFWHYTDSGAVKLSPHKYKFWLQQHNFFKYYPTNSGTFTFIHKDQNLLDESNEKRIKDYVLDYLLNREDIGFKPYDYMANNPKYFGAEYLSFLETADVDIQEDTQDACYIYFKNCVAKVTKNKIEEIDYVNIDGFIWKRQIIDREFHKVDHHKATFRKFLWLISGEDVPRYNSLKSVVGYLLHSYKTSANNKAVIFNDETISEHPNGGSGKGLFWNAIAQLKRVSSIDGKTFEFTKSFPYQTVSTDTQLLVFDDVKKNFNFESLFSLITEGITLEYKGQDAIKLPIQQSPKILITTNYTVGGSGGSFDRRKFEVELSGYFNSNNTPLDEFGHLLFDDWNDEEWDRFYSFMLNCVQYYLEKGLQGYEHKNLPVRKFIKETSHEFYEWVNDNGIRHNLKYDRKQLYLTFIDEHPDFKKWLKQRTFSLWVDRYVRFKELDLLTGKSNGERWIQIHDPSSPLPTEEDELPF